MRKPHCILLCALLVLSTIDVCFSSRVFSRGLHTVTDATQSSTPLTSSRSSVGDDAHLSTSHFVQIRQQQESDSSDSGSKKCMNAIDDSFFNRCNIEMPPGGLTLLADLIQDWINPRFLAQVATIFIGLLPVVFFGGRLRAQPLASYEHTQLVKLHLLNFVHRMTYTLVLDVALYNAFRQSRPCLCPTSSGGYARVGSMYGMPSGDAMSGAIFGAWLMDEGPIFPVGARVTGFLTMILVCVERVALGKHSIGQVTTGAAIGVLLHIYSTRTPQWTIYLDNVIQVVLGFVLLFSNPALVFADNDSNNLFSWLFWGFGFIVFVTMMITWQFAHNGGFTAMRNSFHYLKTHPQCISSQQKQDYEQVQPDTMITVAAQEGEIFFTIISALCMAFLLYLSNVITQYGWF